jgi:hypothetical protein
MKLLIRVEVHKTDVSERRGTSKRGSPYCIREQSAWAHTGLQYPELIKVSLEEGQAPYPPGEYFITEESIFVNQFGGLAFGRVKLIPKSQVRAA